MTALRPSALADDRVAPGRTLIDLSSYDDVLAIAVQADGALWVAGYSYVDNGVPEYEGYRASLARLNADGSLDTSFGDNGTALLPPDIVPTEGDGVAVQPDGKYLIASPHAADHSTVVTRLNPDGTLDTSFGERGTVTVPASGSGGTSRLVVQDDGTILVGAAQRGELTLTRLEADGSLDPTFHGDGAVSISTPGTSVAYGFALQEDGKVLVPGNGAAGMVVTRLNADGTLDTRFGTDGTGSFDPQGIPRAVVVQTDGKILIASSTDENYPDMDFKVIRLNPDGTLDAGFANAGVASIDIAGDYDHAGALTLLGDGSILVGGQSVYQGGADISLIRLTPDGQFDTSFGAHPGHFLPVQGSEGDDLLTGVAANESLQAGAGDDVLDGGGGRDLLAGGEGRDVFQFSRLEDSYRTSSQGFADRILDFNPGNDRIDVAALGFTGLGDGHDGTLAVVANASGTRTYLKSFDADESGRRFEVSLEGDLVSQLAGKTFVFAADQAAPPDLGLLGVSEPGEAG